MEEPFSEEELKVIILEESNLALRRLNRIRLEILHSAVEWLVDLTRLDPQEVQAHIAKQIGSQATIPKATLEVVPQWMSSFKLPTE